MWNVCWRCGLHRVDKVIEPAGPAAICPDCGFQHPFRQLPLLLVSGASGSGKSAVCRALLGQLPAAVLLDSDILWRPEFDTPANHYRAFFETWLRMAKNIGQSGRPVVLFGAGFGVPANLEPCVERRYFGDLHYLALVCDDQVLVARLQERPAGRGSHAPGYLDEHVRFNRWLKTEAPALSPPVDLIGTTGVSLADTAEQVRGWILQRITA